MRSLVLLSAALLAACATLRGPHPREDPAATGGHVLVSVLPLALETLPDSIRSRPLLIDTAAVRRATMADPARVFQQLESTLGRSVTAASVQEATLNPEPGRFAIRGDGLHLHVDSLFRAGEDLHLVLTTRTTVRRGDASALGFMTQEMVFARSESRWVLLRRRALWSD